MERRGSRVTLTDPIEGNSLFDLQLCLQYLSMRKAKQAGRIYAKALSASHGRNSSGYVPVELSPRHSKRLEKLVHFVCERSAKVIDSADFYDMVHDARFPDSPQSKNQEQATQSLEGVNFLRSRLEE